MQEELGFIDGMETTKLLNSIMKIGALMKVGFGEAGVDIIARSLSNSSSSSHSSKNKRSNRHSNNPNNQLNLTSHGGNLIQAIFGFCDVRQFTDTTECLQEEVMLFVNRIAHILHNIAIQCSGAANKNIGNAFLLTWKIDPLKMNTEMITSLADQALLTFVKALIELSRYEEFILYFSSQANQRLYARFPDYHVRIGCGLHVGWAIEGAIGSSHKIDASYLSPHVSITKYLESSTKRYRTSLLMSSMFYELLSKEAKACVRLIDVVNQRDRATSSDLAFSFTFIPLNNNDINSSSNSSSKKAIPVGAMGICTYDTDLSIDWNDNTRHHQKRRRAQQQQQQAQVPSNPKERLQFYAKRVMKAQASFIRMRLGSVSSKPLTANNNNNNNNRQTIIAPSATEPPVESSIEATVDRSVQLGEEKDNNNSSSAAGSGSSMSILALPPKLPPLKQQSSASDRKQSLMASITSTLIGGQQEAPSAIHVSAASLPPVRVANLTSKTTLPSISTPNPPIVVAPPHSHVPLMPRLAEDEEEQQKEDDDSSSSSDKSDEKEDDNRRDDKKSINHKEITTTAGENDQQPQQQQSSSQAQGSGTTTTSTIMTINSNSGSDRVSSSPTNNNNNRSRRNSVIKPLPPMYHPHPAMGNRNNNSRRSSVSSVTSYTSSSSPSRHHNNKQHQHHLPQHLQHHQWPTIKPLGRSQLQHQYHEQHHDIQLPSHNLHHALPQHYPSPGLLRRMSSSFFGNTNVNNLPSSQANSNSHMQIMTCRSGGGGTASGHNSRRSSLIMSLPPLSHLFGMGGSSSKHTSHANIHHDHQQHDMVNDQDAAAADVENQQQEQQRLEEEAAIAEREHARRQQSILIAAAEKRRRARQTPVIQLPRYTRDIWMKDLDLVEVRGGEDSVLFTVEFREQWHQGMQAFIGGEWQIAKRLLTECNRLYVLHQQQQEQKQGTVGDGGDGPAIFLLSYMERSAFIAPSDWQGYRDENKEEEGGGH